MVILFMALFVLGAIIAQNYIYERFWDKDLSLDFAFSSREAFEGDKLYLSEELTNRKPLPLPWIFARFQVSRNLKFATEANPDADNNYFQFDIFSIMMYQRIRRKRSFTCEKRGFYKIRRLDMLCSNLFHTKHFHKRLECTIGLTVFPRPIEDYNLQNIIFKNLDAMILSNSLINPDVFEFKGIREYLPTDSLRFVNFKASAVSQQLMVNIHAPTTSKRLEILLNLEPYAIRTNSELYEQSIRLAAAIAKHYIGEDVKVGLITNGLDISTAQPITIQGGSSSGHLYKIYEALARTAIPLICPPFAHMLDKLDNTETVYAIISPNHDDDLLAAFSQLDSRGVHAHMTVPTLGVASLEQSPQIAVWDASVTSASFIANGEVS